MSKDSKYFQKLLIDRAKRGELVCTPPMGYRAFRKDGKAHAVINDHEKKYVEDVFKLYKTREYTLDGLVLYLNDKYQIGRGRHTTRRLIQNKFYIGYQTINGVEYPHNFDQFISIDDWHACNMILERYRRKNNTKYNSKFFIFKRCIICKVCGRGVTAEEQKYCKYYHCTQLKSKILYHENRSFIREDTIKEVIVSICNDLGFNSSSLFNDNDTMRRFFKIIFEYFVIDGKEIEYGLNPDIESIDLNDALFINPIPLDMINKDSDIKEDKVSEEGISDPILRLCLSAQSIETIMDKLGFSLEETQSKLFDLQLEDKIYEDESGKWQTIKNH